jgi:hypothetical protein
MDQNRNNIPGCAASAILLVVVLALLARPRPCPARPWPRLRRLGGLLRRLLRSLRILRSWRHQQVSKGPGDGTVLRQFQVWWQQSALCCSRRTPRDSGSQSGGQGGDLAIPAEQAEGAGPAGAQIENCCTVVPTFPVDQVPPSRARKQHNFTTIPGCILGLGWAIAFESVIASERRPLVSESRSRAGARRSQGGGDNSLAAAIWQKRAHARAVS